MIRIAFCESGGRVDAINYYNDDGLYDYGVFQIHGEPAALDPAYGVRRAHEKYVDAVVDGFSGLQPWVSSRGCWA